MPSITWVVGGVAAKVRPVVTARLKQFRYPPKVKADKAMLFFGAVLLAGLHSMWPRTFDEISLLLLVLAGLPWIGPILRTNFRSIQWLGAKLEFVEKQLDDQSRRINELYLLSIGEKTFNHLRKLARVQGYGRFYVGAALPREIEFLENLGFIKFKGGLAGLDDFLKNFQGKQRENLSDYLELTKAGRLFVDLREEARRARDDGSNPGNTETDL